MKLIDAEKLIDGVSLCEMSNLTPADTGLDFIIWVNPKTGREKHGPRVKVKIDNIFWPLTLEADPKFIKVPPLPAKQQTALIEFVRLNLVVLLQYWESEGEMSVVDLVAGFEKKIILRVGGIEFTFGSYPKLRFGQYEYPQPI